MIGDCSFDSKGRVYHNYMNMHIPLTTYIALNFINDEFIPLTVLRSKNNEEVDEKLLKIKARPVWTMKNIMINSNNRYYDLRGFIFTEISEDIIEFYRNHNILLSGKIAENYLQNPYVNSSSRLVALVNIDKKQFSKFDLDRLFTFGIPLIKIEKTTNEYCLPILENINKKKIINLDSLNNTEMSEKLKLKFSSGKDKFLSIEIDDTGLVVKYM